MTPAAIRWFEIEMQIISSNVLGVSYALDYALHASGQTISTFCCHRTASFVR